MQSFRMKLCSLWHWRPAPTSGFATRCIPFGYEVQPQTLAIWLGRIDSETVLPVIVNSDYARQGSFDVTREAPLSNSEGGEQKLRAEGKYKTNTHTQRHTDTTPRQIRRLEIGQTCAQVFSMAPSSHACFRTKASMRAAEAAI